MAIAGGLSAQLGIAEESTFGTYVAPTRFLEFTQEDVKFSIERIESAGLRPSRRVLTTDDWVAGRKGAEGSLELEVVNKGCGLLLKHMLGTIATAQPNVGSFPTVYEHTAKVGALDAKSLTVQIGRADIGGTVRAFSYLGCKLPEWELSVDVDGILMLKLSVDGRDETTAQALGSASYASASIPLVYTGGAITVGGVAYDVKKFSLSGNNALKNDRNFIGSALKKEQLEGAGLRAYTGSLDVEFTDLTPYTRFTAGTVGALTAFFTGGNIAGAYNYALEVTCPAIRLDGETPNVGGPDIIEHSLPFTCLDDGSGTTAVQAVYRTTDVTP